MGSCNFHFFGVFSIAIVIKPKLFLNLVLRVSDDEEASKKLKDWKYRQGVTIREDRILKTVTRVSEESKQVEFYLIIVDIV